MLFKKFLQISALLVAFNLPSYAMADTCKSGSKPKSRSGGFFNNVLGGAMKIAGRKAGDGNSMGGMLFKETSRFLTSSIACALSEAEQKQAVEAQRKALDGGKVGTKSTTKWASGDRTAVNGGTTVTSRSKDGGRSCAVTTTFITDINGEQKSVDQEMCQSEDGTWASV